MRYSRDRRGGDGTRFQGSVSFAVLRNASSETERPPMADASPVTSPGLIGSVRLRVGYGFSGRSLLVWQRGRYVGR